MQSEPSQDRTDPRIPPPLGIVRQPTQHDPRLDSKILSAVGRIAPGTELRSAIDDIIRSREGALIVIGEPNELAFLFSGGIKLDVPFTPQLLYELAKMDGAIIVNAGCTKLAYANVQLMPDPTIASNETGHAAPHGRARRQADRRARDLDLAAARDGDGLRRPEPLPARADRRRARQDEPGARDARDLPRPARAGADPADRARVPERGHARRRARRPAARRADDAHGRGDRARLRRAGRRGRG